MILKAVITAMIAAFTIKAVFIFSPPFQQISSESRVLAGMWSYPALIISCHEIGITYRFCKERSR